MLQGITEQFRYRNDCGARRATNFISRYVVFLEQFVFLHTIANFALRVAITGRQSRASDRAVS